MDLVSKGSRAVESKAGGMRSFCDILWISTGIFLILEFATIFCSDVLVDIARGRVGSAWSKRRRSRE